MNHLSFGVPESSNILIQAIDERSLPSIENEVKILQAMTVKDFCLIAMIVDDWFDELSPWKAPAVFGNNSFGNGADRTLKNIAEMCTDNDKDYYLGGYSLSGLFALWASFQTDIFKGVAAASPSIWFPGFYDYMSDHNIQSNTVYLSMGDREGKTKNSVMATVDDCIQKAYELLISRGTNCILEWNRGNHFTDVDRRCARAFAWLLERR